MERPELNPLFNYIAAAVGVGHHVRDAFSALELGPSGEWREESLDTLRRYPLDRVDWRLTNSHRKDIVPLPAYARDGSTAGKGYRNNGTVLPIDERFVEHWNHDPWQLDQGGEGSGWPTAARSCFLITWGSTTASSRRTDRTGSRPPARSCGGPCRERPGR
jgi:hypothetical protein